MHWRYIMDKLRKSNEKLMLHLIYIIFVFSLVYLLALGIDLPLANSFQLLIVVLISTLVKFFLFNPLILYGIILLAIIVAAILQYYHLPLLTMVTERSYFLFDNIYRNLRGQENITQDNVVLFWALLVILLSLFTAYILFKDKNIFILLPPYIFPFLYYWYNFFDEAYGMLSLFLAGFLFLLGLNRYSETREKIGGDGNDGIERMYRPWIKTVFIYSLLILIVSLALPKSDSFVHWPWLQEKVYTFFPNIENLRSHTSYDREEGESTLFNFSTTGFQNDSTKLGGPVNLSNKKVMTVYADDVQYLRGNIKHYYTGEVWQQVKFESKDYSMNRDFSSILPADKRQFYEEKKITIKNKGLASTTIFSPYKPAIMRFAGNHILWTNQDGAISFPNGVFQDESYQLTVQRPLAYGILLAKGIDRRIEDVEHVNIYLQLPEEKITDRTRKLVEEIVADKNTDFEKAVAIEDYLRKNYSYSLDVDIVPQNSEFVDYFLFQAKEGYCTYYATAMAIMLRLEGIPTRYIEGYLAYEESDPGIYEVTQANAHAWVEAFIEPVGWVTFEATPAYPLESRMEGYQLVEEALPDPLPEGNNQIRQPALPDREEIIDDGQMNGENGTPIGSEIEDIEKDPIKKNIRFIFIFILLMILPLRFISGTLHYWIGEYKAKGLSNEKRIIYLYKQILGITELFGFPQELGETHYEYANRVAYRFSYQNQGGIQEVTDIFVRSKYADFPTDEKDVIILDNFRRILDKHLRSSWGSLPYYYRKYVKRAFKTG